MSATDGKFSQNLGSPDLQVFVGASEFLDTSANAVLASAGAGLLSLNLASTKAGTFFTNVSAAFKRLGEYATPLWSGYTGTLGSGTANQSASQEAFGTAASAPGPSQVAGTSGPLALPPGTPPMPFATLATLTGGVAGPIPKGMKITGMDVIYEVRTVAATVATVGLTDTAFANGATPVVTNRIALAANGLPTAAGTSGKPGVTYVAVPSPAYTTTADSETLVNVNLTAGSGGTVVFYGVVLYVTYNFN